MTQPTRTVDEIGDIRWKLPNGNLHREDGPAVEWAGGRKEWWVNGELIRQENAETAQEKLISIVQNFFTEFSLSPLYCTGWADTINASKILKAEKPEEVINSCAFLSGAAFIVEHATPYKSRHWLVGQCMSALVTFITVSIQERNDGTTVTADTFMGVIEKTRKDLLKIIDSDNEQL